ncbi:O-antigen ligase [Rossellomorea aquimaris]|uniref:O-antigen polymerase n=1 Tax=Rossellomorea aquimaris TaxID=189382 RepID=A0A366EQQ1_9BACI|nr:O-antigen ligase family protein [Rossellomorea aquimaris]RBP04718.1 hypothetical protein DET59_1054 [Rossellomorea aquimaris]
MNREKIIHPYIIYVLAFFSSFKNANIYLFGNRQDLLVKFDYLFFIFVAMCLLWILLQLSMSQSFKIDRKVVYFFPLLSWVILISTITTIFIAGNYIPRNLITAFLSMAAIVLGIQGRENFIKTVWAFGVGGGLSAVIPLMLFPEMIGVRSATIGGVFYRGGIWNFTLISFVSVSWLLIALTRRNSYKISKIFAYVIFVVTWVAAFSGLSRSLIILTLTSILVYTLANRKLKSFIQLTTFVVMAVLMVNHFMPNVVNGIEERILLTNDALNNESRVIIWKGYLENIPEYFLVGAQGNYRGLITAYGVMGAGPHSVFLNWLVQYGVFGLIGFIYLLWGLLKEINKVKKESRYEASCLFAWLASYLSLASINQTGFIETSFFVAFGLILTWSKMHSGSYGKNEIKGRFSH